MKEKELIGIKKKLEENKEALMNVVNKNHAGSLETEVGDEADIANSSSEKEITFELNDNERVMLDNIEAALVKIEKHIYGICENCGKKLSVERIKAMPFARYCVDCQSKNEKK